MKEWKFLISNLLRNIWKRDARLIKRYWFFIKQQWSCGWNDSELWSLDMSMSQFILPRLERFRKVSPDAKFISNDDWDKMIGVFKYSANMDNEPLGDYEKLQEGLDLFAKHYFKFWD